MKYCLIILLILLPIPSISGVNPGNNSPTDICRENPVVVNQLEYGAYKIIISSAGDQSCELVDIVKDGESVYHDEDIGAHFYFGDSLDEGHKPFLDILGTDTKNVVLSKWTGGAHCCYTLSVFELGLEFKSIAHIEGGNFLPFFKDINNDGIPEINVTDDFLAYEFSSFAFSASAKVILEYSEGTYKVSAKLMRKPAPDLSSLENKIQNWKEELREPFEGDFPPPSLIQTITDLIFTGNKEFALSIIYQSWPAEISGMDDFIRRYEEALRKSNFYTEFERQLPKL